MRHSATRPLAFALVASLAAVGCGKSSSAPETVAGSHVPVGGVSGDAGITRSSQGSTGSSSSGGHPGSLYTTLTGTERRNGSPAISAADEATQVGDNASFAFALYPQLVNEAGPGNYFYSPFSLSVGLSMAYAGAAGATATQMETVLDFTLPFEEVPLAFDAIDLQLPTTSAGNTQPFTMNVTNAVWVQQGAPILPSYLNVMSADYGTPVYATDFRGDPSGAETAINGWVAGATGGKISPLLPPDAIAVNTIVVLVDAIYFQAAWASQFDTGMTNSEIFTRSDGTTVHAQMMASSSAATRYFKGTGYQAVELPYAGGKASMVIVLPDSGEFSMVEQKLSAPLVSTITSGLSGAAPIVLTMPRFSIHRATVDLKAPLEAMGMTDAFNAADFSRMTTDNAFIAGVYHQAFVDVDENGTLAAAATGVVVDADAAVSIPPPTPIDVAVDRAFFFFIRDMATGTVLFVGREDDPSVGS